MTTVIGVDSGDTAGIVKATWDRGAKIPAQALAWQCERDEAADMLERLLANGGVTLVQIEAWDSRPKRSGLKGTNPSLIQWQVSELAAVCEQAGVPHVIVQASEMKNWATDDRLRAATLLWEITRGQRHARDAARHCLMGAVKHCGLPDPLSRQIRRESADAPG